MLLYCIDGRHLIMHDLQHGAVGLKHWFNINTSLVFLWGQLNFMLKHLSRKKATSWRRILTTHDFFLPSNPVKDLETFTGSY